MTTHVDYESDDLDDPEHGTLRVFAGGNGDWYTGVHSADASRLPIYVRWCTSGGLHPWAAILCVQILYLIGRGKLDRALELARSLVTALGEDRGIENHWPVDPEGS